MITTSVSSTDELVGALDARGVPFLTGGMQSPRALALTPDELLLGLARDTDARVQLAVIPLLLVHPEYAEVVPAVASQLEGSNQLTFRFYYTAAYFLQRKYWGELSQVIGKHQMLPDLFSFLLAIQETEPDAALVALGKRHQTLSGEPFNWRGTYEHAAKRLLKHLELRQTWAI